VQNCLFPVPYPVGIARPPPKNLLPPLRADNVADWTVAARQNHPKLVIKKMYDTEVERSLLELAEAFDKEVTDAGLIVLRKLFHFHTVDPAIWSKRFLVVRRLFHYFKQEIGAVHTSRYRKFLGVMLSACHFPI
jgi:hypothetical protein